MTQNCLLQTCRETGLQGHDSHAYRTFPMVNLKYFAPDILAALIAIAGITFVSHAFLRSFM